MSSGYVATSCKLSPSLAPFLQQWVQGAAHQERHRFEKKKNFQQATFAHLLPHQMELDWGSFVVV